MPPAPDVAQPREDLGPLPSNPCPSLDALPLGHPPTTPPHPMTYWRTPQAVQQGHRGQRGRPAACRKPRRLQGMGGVRRRSRGGGHVVQGGRSDDLVAAGALGLVLREELGEGDAPVFQSASSLDSSNDGFCFSSPPRNSTSSHMCSVQRMWETRPAIVMTGEVGMAGRCASTSLSPSHFQRRICRCGSNQPVNAVRSSDWSGGRSSPDVMLAHATGRPGADTRIYWLFRD